MLQATTPWGIGIQVALVGLAGAIGSQLCPDAYGKNAVSDLTRLPTVSTVRMVGVAVGALVFAALAGKTITGLATSDRREVLESLKEDLLADRVHEMVMREADGQ